MWNYGICQWFVRIFWKNNIQEGYLPKTSIPGQIVCKILAQLCFDDSIQILLNLTRFLMLWTESNLEGFVMESLEHIWANISGCVWLGNLDLDFQIRISDLQSNAKSENRFQRRNICFWIFLFTVQLGNPKKDLKNCP